MIAPVAAVSVVLLMVLPLRPILLDVLLSVDIGLAVVLLLTSLYVREPIEFSVFPSLLLVLTLFRLALNVASTRLILLNGAEGVDAAGHVIMAFGQFVVGGNFVVGVVVFLVLIAIQYIVINHGAVRISEVTARFTLDAMPGKQMAIDADLNAGLIDEKEARERRTRIRREADFYGAMDGAIRFTQRDAVAALLITAINIVAGLVIGVFMHGLDLGTAASTFTILTVGEGLVTAIPALLVSMSGALITTRAASETHLGEEVAGQLFAQPRALGMAAGVLTLLALVPGLPTLPFLFVAGALGFAAYAHASSPEEAEAAATPAPTTDVLEGAVTVDALSVEVGYALIALVDERQGGTLLTRVRSIRKQIASDTGMVVPAGAYCRQSAARTSRLHDSRQGRRSGARRALSGPAPGHQSRDGDHAHRWHRDARAGVQPARVVDRRGSSRSGVGRRLHGRRSHDGALDTPLRDDPHVPARPARPAADERHGGPGRSVRAEAGRGARAEARVGR